MIGSKQIDKIICIACGENLGEIPPNTGVMIVEADGKRYEIRVQSDFKKHAVVIFTFVP